MTLEHDPEEGTPWQRHRRAQPWPASPASQAESAEEGSGGVPGSPGGPGEAYRASERDELAGALERVWMAGRAFGPAGSIRWERFAEQLIGELGGELPGQGG